MYRLVSNHPQTPLFAKILLGLAIGYLLLPFDLIPDFIPVIGQLDDLVIVPGLVYLALKLIPEELVFACRQQIMKGKSMNEIDSLIEGYHRFYNNYFVDDECLYCELANGQHPSTLVIACSDSRVDPAVITDSKPGDLLVVRNVGNLVPPHEKGGGFHGVSAALEFAVFALEVKHIVVFGHRQCGGIKALIGASAKDSSYDSSGEFVTPWVGIAQRAIDRVNAEQPHVTGKEYVCACEMAAVLVSLENLVTFPWIKSRVDEGKLELHGWYIDIETGALLAYNAEKLIFESVR